MNVKAPVRHGARLLLLAVMATAFTLSGNASVEADGPFSGLAGTWYGGGQIKLKSGSTERLRCRGYYSLKNGGSSLGLAILCASTGFKIELRSLLNSHSEEITGTWEERTFHATGEVTGRATSGRITLAITGGISGSMSLTYSGSDQKVSIRTDGTGFEGVSISLARN